MLMLGADVAAGRVGDEVVNVAADRVTDVAGDAVFKLVVDVIAIAGADVDSDIDKLRVGEANSDASVIGHTGKVSH